MHKRFSRLVFSLLSGALLIGCFPKPQVMLLAAFALVPLMLVLSLERQRRWLFLYGYAAGGVFLVGSFYWVQNVMVTYGRLSAPLAAGVLAALVAVFALFFALFSLWVGELARRNRGVALALAPFVWVAVELLRTHLITGLPWNLLGYALADRPRLIQIASLTGIYGISFLLVVVNTAIAGVLLARTRRALLLGTATLLLVGAIILAGPHLLEVPSTSTAVLVQTNLPQLSSYEPNWVTNHQRELSELYHLTLKAVEEQAARPALVLWPEVPAPFYFHHDPRLRAQLMALAQATRTYVLVGIIDYHKDTAGRDRPYNSAVLLAPSGELVGQYDKIHLVPFGEYVPWKPLFGGMRRLVAEVSDFAPGTNKTLLTVDDVRAAVVICYEAIFPALVRDFVVRGADVLVNISNDGWFGRTAAPVQHFNMARVRAVETRRFLLRATNTGITAVIDPYGRVVARVPTDVRTVLVAGFAPCYEQTLYVRYGDWFALLCLVVALAALARTLWLNAVEGTSDGNDGGTRTAV